MKYFAACSVLVACGGAPSSVEPPAPTPPPTTWALPGASGPVSVDFIGYERSRERVWVPVGDTGSVDVFDIATRAFTRVDGFKTEEREAHGRKRMMGPSSVTFGDGVAYVGDRASNEVCVVDEATLKLGACVAISSAPDGVAYVASSKELWVTTPKENSIFVLDASAPATPRPKLVIKLEGETEAYAVDDARGVFYTNLEDKNRTLAIDIASHAVKSRWTLSCSDGPRGVAADHARKLVYVACTDGVRVLDAEHEAPELAKLDTGEGVDIIDYVDATDAIYVAAGKASRLTVVHVDDHGQLSVARTITTSPGVRNAVVDARGTAYAVDSRAARLATFR